MQENRSSKGHKKQNFLIERIAFFSDAVFAIAITLMILDIHPPVLQRGDTTAIVWQKVVNKLPEFMGFAISFLLIGTAWLRHHQLFRYIDGYDVKFMVINLCLLFTIVLFPFSTSFLSRTLFENIVTKPQVIIYLGVPLLSNFVLYLMFIEVKNKHMEAEGDWAFLSAIIDQRFMIFSFLAALAWVFIMPIQYHLFGYFLLGLGPAVAAIVKKKSKHRTSS
jgi:uncharacterized membrane protein